MEPCCFHLPGTRLYYDVLCTKSREGPKTQDTVAKRSTHLWLRYVEMPVLISQTCSPAKMHCLWEIAASTALIEAMIPIGACCASDLLHAKINVKL